MNIAGAIAITTLRKEGYEKEKEALLKLENILKNNSQKRAIESLTNNIEACKMSIQCMELVEQDLYRC